MVKQAAEAADTAGDGSLGKDGQRLLSHQVAHFLGLNERVSLLIRSAESQNGKHNIGRTTATNHSIIKEFKSTHEFFPAARTMGFLITK